MATNTTKYGLKKPAYSDTADIGDINDNMDTIDSVLDNQAGTVGIVCNGKRCATSASTGQYIILQNSTISGKADGLYTAAKPVPANTDLDGTYFTPVSGGGLNVLNSKLTNLGVYETPSAVAGTNVIIVDLVHITIGKLHIIQFNFTVTSQISNGQQLIKAIPANAPYTNCVGGVFTVSGSNVFKTAYLDYYGGSDGVCLVSTGDFPSGSYRGSIVYIAS